LPISIFNVEKPETIRMVENADVIEGCRAIGVTTGTPQRSMVGVVENFLVDRAFLTNRQTQALELAEFADLGSRAPKHMIFNALRSEEHTSELQSRFDLVCRLLL